MNDCLPLTIFRKDKLLILRMAENLEIKRLPSFDKQKYTQRQSYFTIR